MDIRKLVQDNKEYITEIRRYFHMHPELSYQEHETTKKITEELESMGIHYEIPEEEPKTGVIAWIEGNKPGRVVALRADIDALNVTEQTDVEYKSQNEGKMHACGHDAHTAMLLGLCKNIEFCKR